MIDRLYVRQVTENHWQWRKQFADGVWDDALHAGTLELMAESLPSAGASVCLLVPGADTVIRNVSVEGAEKRHLAKLVPYEMEEDIIDPVEDLHFCFGEILDDKVILFYLRRETIEKHLEEIAFISSEIQHVFPEYYLLNLAGASATLVLDGETVIAKFADGSGFAAEINIVPLILESLSASMEMEAGSFHLIAEDESALSILKTCLPATWLENENIEVLEQEGGYWDCLDAEVLSSSLNMRSGEFARKLPIDRWWRTWQVPVYVTAAAFVLSIVVNFSYYLSAKREGKAIRQQMQEVYLQAVPNGRKGDEENRLKTMLKNSGGESSSGEPTNLIVMLGGLSDSMSKQKDIKMANFRYNGEQKELQLNIEVNGLGELGQFRETLASNGLQSGSPRTSRQGQIYQANIKLTEK